MPITQYTYYPAAPAAPLDAHQLQSEKKWVAATNPAACAGTSLTTSFANYDVHGNPGTVTDPNGVVTTLAYLDGRPVSSTINGNTTIYSWDKGQLAAVQHPEGNFDVYCHRQVSLGSACSNTQPWTPQLQWHAKAPNGDGTGYTEGIANFYWPDGRLAREEVWDGVRAEKRREMAFDENSRGQRPRTTVGVGSGAYYVLRRFDADGLLTGSSDGDYSGSCGLQASPAGAGSNTCSNIQNDRMGRIVSMDVVGASSGQTGRTCLTYDAQGNVATVRAGCPSDSTLYPGPSCGACTTPVSTYQSDDFGNVVGVTLPQMSGTISSTFNALGEVLLKQTPAMVPERARTKYTYDALGRELTVVHAWNLPSASSQTLSSSLYDNAATLNANCPQPSNNLGRLLNRSDTFGKTWYRFSPEGRLTGEIRLRSGTTCASQLPRNVPHTFYTYSANGNLTSIQYPYGRTATYVIGTSGSKTTDRPSSLTVTTWNGAAWSPWTALSNIVYEPFGRVRAYQMGTTPTSNVEYLAGATGYSDSNTCPMSKPTTNDYSGRRRLLNASFGALTLGAGAGDIFQEFRAYTGTNPSTLTTCWGSGSAKQWVPTFAPYQQLTNSIYGQYDVRGNRKVMNAMNSDFALDYYYYSDAGVDQLVEVQRSGVPSVKYLYDADGRTTNIRSVNDSTGAPGMEEIWAPSSDGNIPQGGLESVYKTVSIAGAVYSYYYDANNHRRLKQYPTGTSDEFFYDAASRMLVDRGSAAVSSPSWLTTDEYIWLGEKPVVVFRGRLNTTTDVRSADTTAACGRNGESQACGAYFILTDELPKPLALLDDTGKHARRLNWDGFGMTNRVELRSGAQSQHPYPANDCESLYGGYPTLTAGVSTAMRFEVEVLDTEGSASAPVDFLELRQSYVAQSQTGGAHRGRVYTPWVVADGGFLQLAFLSGPRNCPPEGCLADGGLPDGGSYPYYGALVAAIETAERQGGAKAFDIPMRFPGQYYDAESQKHENHNRYYNPLGGTYLSPEPLLQSPSYVRRMAQTGMSVPTYAYGLNNPLRYVDPTGLWALVLYGDPRIPGRNFSTDKPQIATAVQNFALPLTHEKDTSTVVPIDLSAGADEGAFSVGPDGKPWDTVVYVGHGTPSELLPGGLTAIDGSRFAALFGKVGPRNTRIEACNAGGKGSPFRTSVEKAWGPTSTVSGYNRLIEFNWAISGGKSSGGLFPVITGGQITGVTVW